MDALSFSIRSHLITRQCPTIETSDRATAVTLALIRHAVPVYILDRQEPT